MKGLDATGPARGLPGAARRGGAAAVASIPVNTILPVITGTVRDAETLTCSQGTWTNSPSSYAYQWTRDGSNIGGATSSTYELTNDDVGALIACVVVATNAAGSGSATALDVGPVQDGFDADAKTYITAVETADGQDLEPAVRDAINDFVVGCKADGIWDAIKASCILAGARTLTGALVPLKGTAPTNFNFVPGDYNRTTGLVGNGTSKYLNSNRAHNADPQNSNHIAAYVSSQAIGSIMVGGDNLSSGRNYIDDTGGNGRFDCRTIGAVTTSRINANTLAGVSRSSSTSFNYRLNGSTVPQSTSSNPPDSVNTFIYARSGSGVIENFLPGRLSFYSIGEALDLALLDARVTTLINAYGAI